MIDEEAGSVHHTVATGALTVCLYVLAGISAAGGIVMAVGWGGYAPGHAAEAFPVWARALSFLFEGLGLGGLLWAGGWLIRRRDESSVMQRRILKLLEDRPDHPTAPGRLQEASSSPPAAKDSDILQNILQQLSELSADVLLSDDQRETRRLCRQAELVDHLFGRVELALQEDAFDQAEEILRQLEGEVPDDARLGELQTRIRGARKALVQRLLQTEAQRAADLMSVSRFDEAINLADELRQQYPDHPETDELLNRVRREAQTFQSEQCHRLLAIIRECGEGRQWISALAAAHRLLETYADSEEARNVRAMMPTLVDNARIEEVREYRDRIVDMMERRRYAEAVEMAEHVMDNYPETAAAEELRQQIPRLRELAAQDKP